MPKPTAWRAVTALIGTVGLSLAASGCVSIPSGGPVQSYPVSQSANAQNQNINQISPQPPRLGASPSEIVQGFLTASASFVGQQQVAKEYLTPAARRTWKPGWSATVFRDGPTVTAPTPKRGQESASATVTGNVQASLSGGEQYAVASATPKTRPSFQFDLVKYYGQWRISNTYGHQLLLTSTEFAADYQLLNLYFFNPPGGFLVPDPVYVPLAATEDNLMNGLVHFLINQPGDWLGQGTTTHTAFPPGTALQAVSLDGGTASVNLTGKAVSRASDRVKEQISAQLLWTLTGAGQGQQQPVKSIALSINGKSFVPQGNPPDNAVQTQPNQFRPADGPQQAGFYYLKPPGQLMWRSDLTTGSAHALATIGRGYTSLAVSPDGKYLAVVRKGTLYTGVVGAAKLTSRDAGGSDITSLSWDRNDYLWVVADMSIYRLPALPAASASPPTMVAITIPTTCGGNLGDVTALRVAPDGVRVAVVFSGQQETLAFGAIATQETQARPSQQPQPQVSINPSPFVVCGSSAQAFKALSWYGADDVIALGEPGDTVTDYPVSGGTATGVPGPPGSTWITAALHEGLIVSQKDGISAAPGPSKLWSFLPGATSPAFPG
jgi:hypothetical protein